MNKVFDKKIFNDLNYPPFFNVFTIQQIYPESSKNLKTNFISFAKKLGKIKYQNLKKDKIIEIKPDLKKIKKLESKKIKIKSVLRYHQTNLGGSIHSDGPQHTIPPKYIIMACENNSVKGGDTILVDTKKIFKFLKNKKPQILKILRNKIPFERRGFKFSKSNVFFKSIFLLKNKKFIFRYLRDYIEKGYKIKNKKIPDDYLNAFNYLDSLLKNKKFMKKIKLNRGELILLNNHILANGRTTFKLEQKINKRKLYRIWIN